MQENDRSGELFDVLVVGGGIHGTTAAWALTRQGCSVALLEKDDFGAAASANSEKIIHGGLRYLQQLDLKRMRDSIVARRRSFQLLPHLTRPALFLVPTEGFMLRSKAALLAAMLANDVISFDRNRGVPASHDLKAGSVRGRAFLASVGAGLAEHGTGAGVWSDGFVESSERFTLSFVLDAVRRGAFARNYTRAGEWITENGNLAGCVATDTLTGETFEVRARHVVVATGGWQDEGAGEATPLGRPHGSWTRACNILVRKRFFGDYGVGLETIGDYPDEQAVLKRGKRNYFFAPWREGTIIGTTYQVFLGSPDACGITPDEIQQYLEEINQLYPGARLDMDDVTFAHAGILPSRPGKGGIPGADPAKDTELVDTGQVGGANRGLIVRGVKYTTAIQVAEQIARRIVSRDGKRYRPGLNETVYGGGHPVDGAVVRERCSAYGVSLDGGTQQRLAMLYGTEADRVLKLCGEEPGLGEPLQPHVQLLGAEVVHAVRHEQARRLTDVAFRRTDLATFAWPGRSVMQRVADVMGDELGWTTQQREEEVRAAEELYVRMGCAHALHA